MELINQVTSTQFLFPAVAVAGVLILAALVFVFGFKATEQPQFDKLPLVVDDRKGSNKKRKTKEKKTVSNGQAVHEAEVKVKKATSPAKEKKSPAKEKSKEQSEKTVKPKEKIAEVKPAEKKTPKKEVAKPKAKKADVKPADYDDGGWEKVPSKNDKKNRKSQDEPKKESPVKEKKKGKEGKKEEIVSESVSNKKEMSKPSKTEIDKDLQAQVDEFKRFLNEKEERERSQTPVKTQQIASSGSEPDSPDVKDKKKKKVTEEPAVPLKADKKKEVVNDDDDDDFSIPPVSEGAVVFDELGDSWTDAKAPKKGKKKHAKTSECEELLAIVPTGPPVVSLTCHMTSHGKKKHWPTCTSNTAEYNFHGLCIFERNRSCTREKITPQYFLHFIFSFEILLNDCYTFCIENILTADFCFS